LDNFSLANEKQLELPGLINKNDTSLFLRGQGKIHLNAD